jgi:hypothetical protein
MSNILQSVRNAALAGLALATIVSHTGAKSLPSARLTERTTLGTSRSEAARISAGQQEAQTQRAPEPTIGKPVQVTYEDGQLTIIAENSTLSDVMKALREALGTEFDLPTSAASERIWVRLGPGPARRVLRDLLDSTEFNYVIQASDDESGIRSISLTARTKADNPAGVPDKAGASRRAVRGMSGSTASDAADPDSSATQEPSTAADPPATTTPVPAPSTTASTNMQGAGNADLDTSKAAGPMRPEQMMQQLQSMYQQRRQIQAQQNQKASTPN